MYFSTKAKYFTKKPVSFNNSLASDHNEYALYRNTHIRIFITQELS